MTLASLPILSFAFNEGAGNTVSATHGNAVGQAVGATPSISWTTGKSGDPGDYAITIQTNTGLPSEDHGERIRVANGLPDISGWSAFTIMADVKPVAYTADRVPFALYRDNNDVDSALVAPFIVDDTGEVFWTVNDGTSSVTTSESSATIADDTWGHVALTWDGSTLTQYVNGVAEGTSAWSGSLTMAQISFGTDRWWVSGGGVDNFRLFDEALSQSDVALMRDIAVGDEPQPVPLATPVVQVNSKTDPSAYGLTDGSEIGRAHV